jgi:hypothetical protein
MKGGLPAPGAGAGPGGPLPRLEIRKIKFRYGIGPSLRRFGLPLRAVLARLHMTQDDPAHERSLILGPIARRA